MEDDRLPVSGFAHRNRFTANEKDFLGFAWNDDTGKTLSANSMKTFR